MQPPTTKLMPPSTALTLPLLLPGLHQQLTQDTAMTDKSVLVWK